MERSTSIFQASERNPEVESDEELTNQKETFNGKLKLGDEVFLGNFLFDNLKHLELLTGYTKCDILGLDFFLKSCTKLEIMVIVYFFSPNRDVRMKKYLGKEITDQSVILQMPSLRLVKMKSHRGTKNELFVVGLLKKHGVVLEKIVAFPVREGGSSSPPFVL